LYYGRIRRVSKAYEEAKGVVSDVVISFDRQLQRLGEHVEILIHSVEAQTGKNERLASRLTEQERSFEGRFVDITSKAAKSPDIEVVKADLQSLKTQLQDLVKAQEELKERAVTVSEAQIETAIPIRRERALAPLTESELRVLELVAAAGEKTAPEIKVEIKLTREHTARLMKKLYEEGYLERRSDRTPYAYRVKEEMLEFLKKKGVEAS
jgi:DNA-binding MarR family transcriptional regulator